MVSKYWKVERREIYENEMILEASRGRWMRGRKRWRRGKREAIWFDGRDGRCVRDKAEKRESKSGIPCHCEAKLLMDDGPQPWLEFRRNKEADVVRSMHE